MCEWCGCEDGGFQSVKVILPSAKEANPESQEVLVSEDTERKD